MGTSLEGQGCGQILEHLEFESSSSFSFGKEPKTILETTLFVYTKGGKGKN